MPFQTLPSVKVCVFFFKFLKSCPPTSHGNEFRHGHRNVLYDAYAVPHGYVHDSYHRDHQYKYRCIKNETNLIGDADACAKTYAPCTLY